MVGGVGIVAVKNEYVETINLRLADDQSTTLNVESTQSVKYYWGAPKFFIVRNPGSGTLRSQLPVTVEVQDAYENVVESETCEVTLTVTGSVSPSTQTVNIIEGSGTVNVLDTVLETVTISVVDDFTLGYDVSSTRTVEFLASGTPPFI
jgi:hypothetical protein